MNGIIYILFSIFIVLIPQNNMLMLQRREIGAFKTFRPRASSVCQRNVAMPWGVRDPAKQTPCPKHVKQSFSLETFYIEEYFHY